MPEQGSRRGNAVTRSGFEQPFENHLIRFGTNGLNLKDSLDALEGWARHTNVEHDSEGEATARPGQTSFATGGTKHHSIRKLRDPQAHTEVRIWGIDTNLYRGVSGALTQIDSGYSGDPLSMTPHRPPLSGDPWMFVADRNKMRKVRADGLDLPIGMHAPTAEAASALGIEYRRVLADFLAPSGTNAAAWTMVPGTDETDHPTEAPEAADDAGSASQVDAGMYVILHPGASVTSSFDSWVGVAVSRDANSLSPVSGPPGDIAASDNDIFHAWLKTSKPELVEEIRIYVVVSTGFDPLTLPGVGETANTDAYVKGFRQNDFVQFIQTIQTQIDAAETARTFAIRDRDLQDRTIADERESWAITKAATDPQRARSLQIGTGAHQWFELGSIGIALRRGDFQRIGNTPNRDWGTITGIIVYMSCLGPPEDVAFGVGDLWLTGGFGPDTLEPGAQQYDYRSTNYDPRTGAESNGSPIQLVKIDSLRRVVLVTPQAFGDGAVRQRIYRRGGSLFDDWFFEGQNASDGGVFEDTLGDDSISASGTLPIDHFQPVPTIDDNGNTVLAQPAWSIFGPIEGMLLACGDPYRPGHLYWSMPDAPDHWSASGNVEVCPPSEVLQAGGVMGHQGFVFSLERLHIIYPNLSGGSGVQTSPSLCKRGLSLSRWAFTVGPGGIYFAAEDGFFRTTGGPEEWIGREIQPLFEGHAKHGLPPIDKTVPTAMSVTAWENKIYFTYQDTDGGTQTLVYSILNKFWRHYSWAHPPATLQGDDEPTLLIGGQEGKTYLHDGFSDDGAAISCVLRTGASSGGTREEKLFGDQFIDGDRAGVILTVRNFLNEETVTNLTQDLNLGSGRERYILDAFGESPQLAHSISTEILWSSSVARPVLYQMGFAITLQPDITNRRVTNWDDLGSGDQFYSTGITLDCDTHGLTKPVLIERDYLGVKTTIATLQVTCAGRHKVKFSWPGVPANMIRVHPESEACLFWILYRADWIFQQEPPLIAGWDVHFENKWDQYHTGLDLYCDTGGLEKRIWISVDNVFLNNDLAGLPYWPIVTSGRQVVHLTMPWGRGHVYHFEARDANPGLLYEHRWHLDPEPTEQANWTQNFTILGSRADKWMKAVVFECDTFGANKSVEIQADGVTVETLIVNALGRKVVQLALTEQKLGRVWRMFPVDGNPGRLYSVQPIFDEEPFMLTRWETQETNHNLPGWFYPLYGHIVYKSTQDVTLTTVMSANQTGRLITEQYVLPATGGVKQRRFLNGFRAGKGVLIKYILTSPVPFFLYRDEMIIVVQPWGSESPVPVRPFGNDDLDPTRTMRNAVYAAQAPGGSADTGTS
jgi:hypothetical protein